MLHLANISEDVLIHIASYLELDDLWRLRQVKCAPPTRAFLFTHSHFPRDGWVKCTCRCAYGSEQSQVPTSPWSIPDSSELPASLVRDTVRAARIDRRWSAANPCEFVSYPSPDGVVWTHVKLAGGQWVLCTDERGDVTATHLAVTINRTQRTKAARTVFDSDFDPYCAWSGPVGWFRSPAILITQLKADFRSLIIRCFSLPSVDPQPTLAAANQLSQCKLNVGAISVLALEVHAATRCLMLLCKDPSNEPRLVFLSVWRWGPDEEHTSSPPRQIMRTAPFEAKDCEFRLVEAIGGPHVLVVRASEDATHFEFYDLPGDAPEPALIEPEAQIPVAGASLPCECHQITLPQPGSSTGADNMITVLICVATSARNSELQAYRVLFDGHNARLSLSGRSRLAEYFDVIDCVLGERGARGVASIAAPRRDTRVTLALLTCGETFQLRMLEHSALDLYRPMRLAFDELRGTIVFLDSSVDGLYVVLFDSDLPRDLQRT